MALEQRLNLKMAQRLVMTPSLQQAIRLLQLSKLELAEEIAQELVENPVLEEQDEIDAQSEAATDAGLEQERVGRDSEEGGNPTEREAEPEVAEAGETDTTDRDALDEVDIELLFREPFESGGTAPNMREIRELPSLENTAARQPDLHDHLLWQLGMQVSDAKIAEVAKVIIWNLDDDGYLQATDAEILDTLEALADDNPDVAAHAPYGADDVERARRKIGRLDPVGIGARTLDECLLLQLEHLGLEDSLAAELVAKHLGLLRLHKYAEIARKLGVDEAKAREVADVIRALNPKPGAGLGSDRNYHVVPDVVVAKVDGEYKVLLNDEGLPRLRISPVYRRLLERAKAARAGEAVVADGPPPDRETRDYVREKFRSALWFIKSLDQRQQTIFKVAESIVKHQRGFLDQGLQALRPLVLRDVAEDVEMHESTVSRVVTNKYMHTPQGLVEMKFFFHAGLSTRSGEDISSLAVKERIKGLIEEEPTAKPLSDSAIVKLLKGQGIDIARRTVAKYRDELSIPASPMRKRMERGALKTRIFTSALLLPVVAAIYLAPPWLFLGIAGIGIGLATWEAAGLFRTADRPALRWVAVVAVGLLLLSFHRPDHLPLSLALAVGVGLVVGAQFLVGAGVERSLDGVAATLAVVLVPGFLLAFQVGLRHVDREVPDLHPPALLLFCYAAVFGNDSAAYFVGRAFGRTRLAPAVSPGKSVEGFLGGLVGGIALAVAFDALLPTGLGTARAAGYAFLLTVAAVLGDLTISLLKRSAGVKDTGHVLPGHGGLLDRLDGLLFSSPLLYLACTASVAGQGGP